MKGIAQACSKLRLLATAGADPSPTPYAFVRWLKPAPIRGDLLDAAGCIRVVYDTEGAKGVYEVVYLSTIICRHHLVPSFQDKAAFYISFFSPTRAV